MYPQFVIEAVYFLIVFVVIVFLVVFYVLSARGRRREQSGTDMQEWTEGMGRGEKRWLMFLFAVAVIGNLIFLLPILPSMRYAAYEKEAVMTVTVEMRNYKFLLPEKPIKIPANVPIEFIVVSDDLVYGFGVFRKDGTMVFQMQVVPKPYVNRIVWVFDEPGLYDVRSTEYSGPMHPLMYIPDAILVVGEEK